MWVTAALGFICTSAALEGYFLRILTTFDRCLMGVAGVALFWNGMWYKATGCPDDRLDRHAAHETERFRNPGARGGGSTEG